MKFDTLLHVPHRTTVTFSRVRSNMDQQLFPCIRPAWMKSKFSSSFTINSELNAGKRHFCWRSALVLALISKCYHEKLMCVGCWGLFSRCCRHAYFYSIVEFEPLVFIRKKKKKKAKQNIFFFNLFQLKLLQLFICKISNSH